jgi:stage V sporulation protein G
MEITEVRIKLMDDPQDRLQAFCSITFDHCFVVRDLKIIQGTKGSFVAMPSRKLTDRCPRCSAKNHLRSRFCSECGAKLREERALKDEDGRAKLYADIAHPIHSDCRDMIQHKVLQAYEEEQEKAKLPGYICSYDDYGEERFACLGEDGDDSAAAYILPVDDSLRRRDAGAAVAQPHTIVLRTSSHAAHPINSLATCPGDDGEEAFGAGLI